MSVIRMNIILKIFFSLILFLSYLSYTAAEENRSKDWYWGITDEKDATYALTQNSSKRILGQFCIIEKGDCLYMVSLGVGCIENDEYPSIVNSDAGVAQVTLICGGEFEGENVFYIYPYTEVDRIVKEAITVAFAVAMERGEFKVVRFSLAGSSYALEVMRAGAEALMDGNGKDQYKRSIDEEYL